MTCHIDSADTDADGFYIYGWYIDDGSVKLSVFDPKGNPLSFELKKTRRPDVHEAFPENKREEIIGFKLVCEGGVQAKVRLRFYSASGQRDVPVTLIRNRFGKMLYCFRTECVRLKSVLSRDGIRAMVGALWDAVILRGADPYEVWCRKNRLTRCKRREQRAHSFSYEPKISIVVPLYRTQPEFLRRLADSVRSQTYENWELCLSDGSGDSSPLSSLLSQLEKKDDRIRVVRNHEALRISENTNRALEISTGDFIAFADHDDLLAPDALYECAAALNEDRTIDALYTDEDKVDPEGKSYFQPHFKSDLNIDLLRSMNYICHLFVVKREILEQVGSLNPDYDGAQDYDFILRCAEKTKNIKHIPKILYHWRAHPDSTAENPESKEYAFEAGARAIQAHYDRLGIRANVTQTDYSGAYRTRYELQTQPLVSVIIPNKDHTEDLDKCIRSIEAKSAYRNIEYIVVENNSEQPETFAYYKKLEQENKKVRVVCWREKGFNFPAINNFGVSFAKGEYILLLNNDTEIIREDCIEELLGYCMRPDVGAVGARLYYEDGTIQHAGVVVGLGGVAGHAFVGFPHDAVGYFRRIIVAQDYSAVTAACMMVKKSVFEEVGGFNTDLAVAFNDIDLCLKIRQAGYLIVYNPYAELNHYESKSRGYEDNEEKIARFQSEIEYFTDTWSDFLKKGDPYYSPHLTLAKNDFSLSL